MLHVQWSSVGCLAASAWVAAACGDAGERVSARVERGGEVRAGGPVDGVSILDTTGPDGGSVDLMEHDAAVTGDGTGEVTADVSGDAGELPDLSQPDSTETSADAGPDVSPPLTCQLGAVVGVCVPVGDCPAPAQAVEQLCGDDRALRCCLAAIDRCSSDGTAGACLDVAACEGADVEPTAGLCPGAASVQCCHPREPAPRCTDA